MPTIRMPLSIAVLSVAFLVAVSAAFDAGPSSTTKPASSLVIAAVGLPDGQKWTIGEAGLGRPFAVRIVLANNSAEPLKLWPANNTEGAACARIVLTSADDKKIELVPAPLARSGIPTVLTLESHRTTIIDLDLLRLIGDHSPPAGQYTLEAIYQNALDSSDPVRNVWTGELRSKPLSIEIARPG